MVWYWKQVLLNLGFESRLWSFSKNGRWIPSFKKQYAHKCWGRSHSRDNIWRWESTKSIETKAVRARRFNGWIWILIIGYVRRIAGNLYRPISRLRYQNKWQTTFKNIMSYKTWSNKWWSIELDCTWWS